MRFSSLVFFITTAFGAPVDRETKGPPRSKNLDPCSRPLVSSPEAVTTLVNDYAQVVGNYSDALANSFLANGFTDTSDSINFLAGIPLGSVTFASKEAFMESQETQPKIPLVVTSTNAITENTVVIRYTQTFGAADLPVAGISILDFVCEDDQWKLKTLHTEFNTAAYVEDIGGVCTA